MPRTASYVDLGELDSLLHAGGGHGALAGVGVSVTGADRLSTQRTGLGEAVEQWLSGQAIYTTAAVQTVLTVSARVCGETHCQCTGVDGGKILIRLWRKEHESLSSNTTVCPLCPLS